MIHCSVKLRKTPLNSSDEYFLIFDAMLEEPSLSEWASWGAMKSFAPAGLAIVLSECPRASRVALHLRLSHRGPSALLASVGLHLNTHIEDVFIFFADLKCPPDEKLADTWHGGFCRIWSHKFASACCFKCVSKGRFN